MTKAEKMLDAEGWAIEYYDETMIYTGGNPLYSSLMIIRKGNGILPKYYASNFALYGQPEAWKIVEDIKGQRFESSDIDIANAEHIIDQGFYSDEARALLEQFVGAHNESL
jgi:hypothetical protein